MEGAVVKRRRARVGGPDPVDRHVGTRVRTRRTLMGISQERLGELIGLTFQQVQKYEKGENRISASKLWRLCQVLDVPVAYFYETCPDDGGNEAIARDKDIEARNIDLINKRETLELVRAAAKLSPDTLACLLELAKALGGRADKDNG